MGDTGLDRMVPSPLVSQDEPGLYPHAGGFAQVNFCKEWFSLYIIGWGLGLAVVTAALVVTGAMLSPLLSDWVQALMAVLHPLPGIAVLPVIILWLGTGSRSIVAVIWFSSVWPLIANLHTGLRSVPTTQIEVGRNLGLKGIPLVRSILLPGLSYILTGLRVVGPARGRLRLPRRWFWASGGEGGLGWFIYKNAFHGIPSVFGGMIIIILIGLLVERLCFEEIELRTVRRWE